MARLQSPERPTIEVATHGAFGAPKAATRWRADSSNVSTGHAAFHAQYADAEESLERAPRHRNRSVWAQALVLFNIVGIPLSYGAYLEYYFTTLLPDKSLWSLALIIGLQIFGIFAMPFPIGYLYHRLGERAWWKALFALAAIIAVATQIALHTVKTYILVVLLQGPILGIALGTLSTISTLVLASHYQGNLPVASVQSGFAGFAGAIVHTTLARFSFQAYKPGYEGFAQASSGGVLGATLLIAYFLLARVKEDPLKPWTIEHHYRISMPTGFLADLRNGPTIWFLIGYILILFSIFIYPFYILLLLTQPPALSSPDFATFTLLATLGTAACSACVSANLKWLKCLGAVNTFVAASVFAGSIMLLPVTYPAAYITIPLGGAYGIALGAILSLHSMVLATFLGGEQEELGMRKADTPARVAIVMAVGGLSAFAGIVVSAVVIESAENGSGIMLNIAGACAMGGGVILGSVRLWRWEWRYAV